MIFFWAILGYYGPPLAAVAAGSWLFLLIVDHARRVFFRLALDVLELRARVAIQEQDRQRRSIELELMEVGRWVALPDGKQV